MYPAGLRYTREHHWLRVEKDMITLGVTNYAQEQLTDIVFVELPDVGRKVKIGESVAALESVSTVSDLFCPFSGTVVEVNEELVQHPEKINDSPHDEGWIVKLKVANPDLSRLMDAAAYEAYVAQQPPMPAGSAKTGPAKK